MYIQKQSPLWWTGNIRTIIYFLRELTGVFIALYALYFLGSAMADPRLEFILTKPFTIVSSIGLFAAIFHTVTWLWVTAQVTPVPIPKAAQIGLFIFLMLAWAGVSYFLFSKACSQLLHYEYDETTRSEACLL